MNDNSIYYSPTQRRLYPTFHSHNFFTCIASLKRQRNTHWISTVFQGILRPQEGESGNSRRMFHSKGIGYFVILTLCSSFVIYHLLAEVPVEEQNDGESLSPSESINGDRTLKRLEKRLAELESMLHKQHNLDKENSLNCPKKYPDVKFLNYQDRKRILITGGAGFVGSHLVDKLMLQGHEVIVADNFFTGRKRNVEHWVNHENFELLNHDIVNPLYIEVDEIYHLASPASPPHYMFNPVKTIKTNTMGTINVLGLAKRVRAKILIASTSEVYGDPEEHPQTESYWGHVNPIGPRACYDEGKRVAETLSYSYAKQSNVDIRVARIFNTYGPRMHMNDGRVVSNFILQALQDEPITIYGDGKQTRSFQYVQDLVEGLVALMNSNYTKPVNIGNPNERTITRFAELIKAKVGSNSEIKHLSAVEDDPQRRRPDISLAKRVLGWKPIVKFQDGIQKTIDYFRNELSRSNHSDRNIHHPDAHVVTYSS